MYCENEYYLQNFAYIIYSISPELFIITKKCLKIFILKKILPFDVRRRIISLALIL